MYFSNSHNSDSLIHLSFVVQHVNSFLILCYVYGYMDMNYSGDSGTPL